MANTASSEWTHAIITEDLSASGGLAGELKMQGLVKDDASRTAESVICAINDAIAERIGQQKFNIWFKNSTRLTFGDGLLKVGVANQFISTWLESHFHAQVADAARAVVGNECRLLFAVDPQLCANNKSAGNHRQVRPPKASPSPGAGWPVSTAHDHIMQPVLPAGQRLKLRFDTFVVGPSNELAYNAAKAVVCDKQSPFNPLFIHGGYGLGKTHLLQGICNETRSARPTANWLYMSAEDFANQFVLALKTRKLEAFRRRMRQTDLLAIDDIHFLASKPATQDEFLFTFNALDLAGRQVVLASDSHPKMIDQLSEKLVNRFVSGMVVKINTPDFKTRCQIVRRFAHSVNTSIPQDVIGYIADNMKSSVRELQGAILKLTAFASLQNAKIDMAMAGMVLAEHVERCDPTVHLSDIESAVASFFGVPASAIHSSKKDRTIALARHFCMYLARKNTRLSSSEIGRLLGDKNHATVLLACKKIEDQIAQNAPLNWQGPAGNRVCPARTILEQLENNIR
ncbi:MAG: chromosomal replication initiator protein DnaA [Sedimentisphaerales bacterium]|nr:chromosomal replication initiator protein DnaA [Sedimentisphaerales bacterium]